MLTRRLASVASLAALAGCAAQGSPTTPAGGNTTTSPVNLPVAQSEASAVLAAFETGLPALLPELSASVQNQANLALSSLKVAVGTFVALPANATFAQSAMAVVQAVAGVAAVVPMPPQMALAVAGASVLLNALIAGLSSVTVTTPAASTTTASATLNGAPIAIPLGR